ncbi:MAG: penicillin-binding transpeptidase domain-containing protein, partial [Candidatus Dormibacteraeota bacterium]|nr:penicillin-binding transpeptidase domain-containing protein [Candidatus Dormibacteraeota bacterium]
MALSAGSVRRERSGRGREKEHRNFDARTPSFRLRALWLLAAALILAFLIWGRLVYWQVSQHSKLAGDALTQYSKVIELPATRGMVYDRNGQPLAINEVVYSVFLSPDQVPKARRPAVAAALNSATGRPVEELQAILASNSKFAYVARRQPKEAADRLKALHLPGVGLEPESQRSYLAGGTPNTTLAANLLGFVNNQGTGQYGVEAFYQQELAGHNGSMSTFQDLTGREIIVGGESRREPVNGSDLHLTIDANIQHSVEQALAEGVIKNKAEIGSVIVMDPHTGGIIAWADYPTYNANDFARTSVDRFIDPIASHLYEPGSTMKVVTL